jgi:DNA gyrase subunit A
VEELRGGRNAIIITEIPFQVNKSGLIERIAELVRDGRIDAISDLRDESDRRGMSIVIELKRGAKPKQVLNQLYKYTPLQTTFGVNLLALVDGEPRLITLKRALQIYIEHRKQVITRRSQYELEKARARAHILEGLLIALANLDDVIQTIRQSPDAEQARQRLIRRFKLSELQAQAILDMQLRRLAALERQKIEDEHKEILARIAYLEDLLASPKKILDFIHTDLNEISDKYGDERRTRITAEASLDFTDEDLVPDEAVLITFTQRGYIKRVAASAYRAQARGGRGVTGQAVREEDAVLMLIPARTLDTILFFSDRGKVYSEKVHQIPDAGRTDRGVPLVNVLSLSGTEKVTAAVTVPDFDQAQFCTMSTLSGKVKRMELSELASVRPSGLIAINLEQGDELGWARLTRGKDDIILVTANGRALRISETDIRPTGRQAGGVTGIRLGAGDRLAGMEVVEPDADLLVITEQGYGKRSSLADYSSKGRATGGVVTLDLKNLASTGKIAAVRVVHAADDLTIISANGVLLRIKVKEVRTMGRAARGVRLMNVQAGDTVASLARITAEVQRSAATAQPQPADGQPEEETKSG